MDTNCKTPPEPGPITSRTIVQPYREAYQFQLVRYETPKTLQKKETFRWATHLLDEGDIKSKFGAFVSSTRFPVNEDALTKICTDTFTFCNDIYHNVLFPARSPQLHYHNVDHALITSITAQKMFLGGLVQETQNGKIKMPTDKTVSQLHRLFALVTSFHEIDDWWNLHYPGNEGVNPHIEEAKNNIAQKLTEMGLLTHDFNRLLMLDDFTTPQKESLKTALALPQGEGFLPKNKVQSLLDTFQAAEQKKILIIASKALCAADFLQTVNPAYLQPTSLNVDGKIVEGHAGPFALAAEMSKWRTKALRYAGFGELNGTVDWNNVTLSLNFFETTALPRINSGIDYLNVAVPSEFVNAKCVINNILSYLSSLQGKSQ